jgi:hypothetical protein
MSNPLRDWWEALLEFFRHQDSYQNPSSKPKQRQQQQPQPEDVTSEHRYSVQSESLSGSPSHEVASVESLAEAHQQWQQLTGQKGRIVDTQTGQDVTPEPDDDGRYVVLDASNAQQGSYDDLAKAEQAWQELTDMQGRIVDTQTGKEVTPNSGLFLTSQQLAAAINLSLGASKRFTLYDQKADPELIAKMIPEIARLKLPVFDITNVAGKGNPRPTKKVPIKRRKVTIKKVRRIVEVESTGKPEPTGRIPVVHPTDDVDIDRIRGVRDLTRVSSRQLAVPPSVLGLRVARRELTRPVYFDDTTGPAPIQKRKVWQEVEEPQVEEWTENVEVSEDPQSQLLECVIDISFSMQTNFGLNLAIALMCVLNAKHMTDGSRYLLRPFGTTVGKLKRADTERDKQQLGKYLMFKLPNERVGNGTSIWSAITVAARDVRALATREDRPEVLLLTDGADELSPEMVYEAIGDDVILHTVVTGGPTNESLRKHSSTYAELSYWTQSVVMSDGKSARTPFVPLW